MSDQRTLQGFFTSLLADQAIGQMVAVAVSFVPGGSLVAPLVSKALEYYGVPVADNLVKWVRGQKGPQACAVLEAVANLSPAEAMQLAQAAVKQTAPPNAPPERLRAIENYLASIPAAFKQSMPRAEGGKTTCPAALLPQTERQAMALLPTYLPPYNAPCELPGTPYQLVRLVGTGGFGAVYEAKRKDRKGVRAIKFCLDPDRVEALKREKMSFEKLKIAAEGDEWPKGVIRYLGGKLDHKTPFLVFEYAPDGDLVQYVQTQKARTGRAMTPEEVLTLMRELATAAGQMHAVGLTHRDLKPSNVLFAGKSLRIADLGLGAVMPQGNVATRLRSIANTTQEARGAGTALYMAPEQKRGESQHTTQDVYSLGVIWYQLLVNDFNCSPGPTWRKSLEEKRVPKEHIDLLESCFDHEPTRRPQNGAALAVKQKLLLPVQDDTEETEIESEERSQASASRVLIPTVVPAGCAISTLLIGLLPNSIFGTDGYLSYTCLHAICLALFFMFFVSIPTWCVRWTTNKDWSYSYNEAAKECRQGIIVQALAGLVAFAAFTCMDTTFTWIASGFRGLLPPYVGTFTLPYTLCIISHGSAFVYSLLASDLTRADPQGAGQITCNVSGWAGCIACGLMISAGITGTGFWVCPIISFVCFASALAYAALMSNDF